MSFKKVANIKQYVQEQIKNRIIMPSKYVKATTITARKGIIGERISTITSNDLYETNNIVSKDLNGNVDWVVTNITGEQYIIKDFEFNKKYEPDEGASNMFKPKGKPITAGQIHEDISFTAPWGEAMSILAGGYLVFTDMDDIYGIQESEFNMTYKKLY